MPWKFGPEHFVPGKFLPMTNFPNTMQKSLLLNDAKEKTWLKIVWGTKMSEKEVWDSIL